MALWASRAPLPSPGSLESTAAAMPLLDKAIGSRLCQLLSDQAAMKAVATPAFIRENTEPDAFLPEDVAPVLAGFTCIVEAGVVCTSAIIAAFMEDTLAVLADKAKQLQAMFPEDLEFLLAPTAKRSNSQVTTEVLSNAIVLANLSRSCCLLFVLVGWALGKCAARVVRLQLALDGGAWLERASVPCQRTPTRVSRPTREDSVRRGRAQRAR